MTILSRHGRQFLLTPLREGRPLAHGYDDSLSIISTHAPAGGATKRYISNLGCMVFLLTPLREGRPTPVENIVLYYIISTHAPAGGATASVYGLDRTIFISTHAPAGGATLIASSNPI